MFGPPAYPLTTDPEMNILVLGGTGFISGRLVDVLLADGHHVTTLTRSGGRANNARLDHVAGDRNDASVMRELARTDRFDAVVDMVAYRPEESRLAVDVFRGRVDRFIHCSTASVYMVSADVRCPITIDQADLPPNAPRERNPFGYDYGMLKRECEDVLWTAHDAGDVAVTMFRPTFVCGPGDPTARDAFWIVRILDGKPVIVPGTGEHVFQQVFVDDVARMFAAALRTDESVGKAYNVASEESRSLNEVLSLLAGLLDQDPEFVHIPQDAFDQLDISTFPGADVFPFNTRRTAVMDLSGTLADLGVSTTPFETWMKKTIDWFRPRLPDATFGYDRREREVRIAREYMD